MSDSTGFGAGSLTVDGGVTIDVDTAAVRALAQSIEAAHDAVRACTMAVTRAVMMAHAQLLGSAVVSPVTAARVSASLGQLAWPAGTLGWAALHLSLDCRRVAAAYDAAEGRAAETLRFDDGYHGLTRGLAAGFEPRHARLEPVMALAERLAPTGIADLAGWFEGYQRDEPGGPGRIDVIERTAPGPDGGSRTSYTVVLPGTSSPLPLPCLEAQVPDARNISANLRLASNQSTPEVEALPEALARAGVPHDAQLTLIGHSQGGMTALAAAMSPAMRAAYRVKHVVTFGSPVARMPLPADLRVLSVEHRGDPVPSLDLAPNQATARHVTVRAGADRPGQHRTGSHAMEHYVPAAAQIDASSHPSLVEFEQELRNAGVLAAPSGDPGRVRVRRVEVSLAPVPEASARVGRMD